MPAVHIPDFLEKLGISPLDLGNVKGLFINVPADLGNVAAFISNVEADLGNVKGLFINAQADLGNVQADLGNVKGLFINVQAVLGNVAAVLLKGSISMWRLCVSPGKSVKLPKIRLRTQENCVDFTESEYYLNRTN